MQSMVGELTSTCPSMGKKKLTLHFYFINTLYSSRQFCTPRNIDASFYSLPRKGGEFFYVLIRVRIPQMKMKPDEGGKENRKL